jgi:large subunit ribosomal protein L9
MTMEVILKADVENLGKALDVVKVKNGYARNFLFPRKLAIAATQQNKEALERDRARLEAAMVKQREAAAKILEQIEKANVTISAKVHEEEKLYGSVTASDIAETLKAQGLPVEKRHIELDEPIKQLGVYTAKVKLMVGVEGKVKVWVVKDANA